MDNVSYLLTCSELSRESFILAKLDQSARLRKEIARLLNEWIEAEALAMLGDIIREAKRTTIVEPQLPDILPQRQRLRP